MVYISGGSAEAAGVLFCISQGGRDAITNRTSGHNQDQFLPCAHLQCRNRGSQALSLLTAPSPQGFRASTAHFIRPAAGGKGARTL